MSLADRYEPCWHIWALLTDMSLANSYEPCWQIWALLMGDVTIWLCASCSILLTLHHLSCILHRLISSTLAYLIIIKTMSTQIWCSISLFPFVSRCVEETLRNNGFFKMWTLKNMAASDLPQFVFLFVHVCDFIAISHLFFSKSRAQIGGISWTNHCSATTKGNVHMTDI